MLREAKDGGTITGTRPLLSIRIMGRIALTAASAMLAALVCVSCAKPPEDLSTLTVDPLECTALSLRRDVKIRVQTIHEPSFMQNRFLVVLRYREGGDETEFNPKQLPGYTNVSLVVEAEATRDDPFVVLSQYSVIEIWSLNPETKTRICHLWSIGIKDVSMKLLLEDFNRRFLAEKQIALTPAQVVRLKQFYARLMGTFLERLRKSPGST